MFTSVSTEMESAPSQRVHTRPAPLRLWKRGTEGRKVGGRVVRREGRYKERRKGWRGKEMGNGREETE